MATTSVPTLACRAPAHQVSSAASGLCTCPSGSSNCLATAQASTPRPRRAPAPAAPSISRAHMGPSQLTAAEQLLERPTPIHVCAASAARAHRRVHDKNPIVAGLVRARVSSHAPADPPCAATVSRVHPCCQHLRPSQRSNTPWRGSQHSHNAAIMDAPQRAPILAPRALGPAKASCCRSSAARDITTCRDSGLELRTPPPHASANHPPARSACPIPRLAAALSHAPYHGFATCVRPAYHGRSPAVSPAQPWAHFTVPPALVQSNTGLKSPMPCQGTCLACPNVRRLRPQETRQNPWRVLVPVQHSRMHLGHPMGHGPAHQHTVSSCCASPQQPTPSLPPRRCHQGRDILPRLKKSTSSSTWLLLSLPP